MIRQLEAITLATAVLTATIPAALAQDKGSVNAKPLPPLANPDDPKNPAKELFATMVVAANRLDVDPKVWSHQGQFAVIKAAAEDPEVERIFVNAAIKKALCREAGKDRAFLHKVRPWWGHDYHFHVRIVCQAGSPECKGQEPPGETEGCGHDLDYWFSDAVLHPQPPKEPPKAKPPITMADLPAACRQVLLAP